jgi:2,3-bisphosphoglycerate-independent phosphoglycerate mutase
MSNRSGRQHPVALVVLDGWGHRVEREGNAIEMGHTPVWHRLWKGQPTTLLDASGLAVGLPEGQMGNSEVGHLNLGAGRVVAQDLVRISQSIKDGSFFDIESLVAMCECVRTTGGTLHVVGLLGNGGVHALDRHVLAAIELGVRHGVSRIALHGFLDGRDSPPKSGRSVLDQLMGNLAEFDESRVVIGSLIGRYYAMDRDRRWDRTRLAFDALSEGIGRQVTDPRKALEEAYAAGETDEFVKPIVLVTDTGAARAPIRKEDAIFFVNFRADRMRQIVGALSIQSFDGFATGHAPVTNAVTMTRYDDRFGLPAAFAPATLSRILAELLAEADLTQFRTAETEKYPHVTYFFNGGIETPFPCEERVLIPSPRVATYDLEPEMSAIGITDAFCGALERADHDFLLCNYANADMVGHTGLVPAILKAVETLDGCLDRVVRSALASGTRLLVTADHGNCEVMIDPDTGGPHTTHTTNPVPFVAVGTEIQSLRNGGALCDVAPTILQLMGLEQPTEMSGRSLMI